MTTIRIRTTEDAVAHIAAMATKVIAEDGHEGHDLEAVGARITSDEVLDTIRRAYLRRLGEGMTVREAFTRTGQALIAHYCNAARIPTDA
ncbi:hypothetical protein ACFYNV_29015 [Streptomyces albidoflavus]